MWEIARPTRVTALPGVDMAGFRYRGDRPLDLRAIPHPAITVVVEFAGQPVHVRDAAGRTWSDSLVAGLAFGSLHARVESIECVQIRVSPIVTRAVLGVPPAELGGSVVTLDDLWGRDVSRIREQLHDARTWPQRFALIDTALSGRLQTDRLVDPEMAFVWRQIVASRGRVRVANLAAKTGWSRQHLWSRFGAHIGLTPKHAAMLVRFDHAIHRLVSGDAPAEVAADSGYADQSHLHREVRAFTGATLSASAAEPWLAVDNTAWPTRVRRD